MTGTIDLCELVRFKGVFAPHAEQVRFSEVSLLDEMGTIGWPGGAVLAPDVLYARITNQPTTLALKSVRTSRALDDRAEESLNQ